MAVEISRALLARLRAEAAASPHAEICGLLFGACNRIDRADPTANVAADPARTFEIDPAALFAAHRAARAGGPRMIGHYHSHPGGSAHPSATDAAMAEPGRYWLILGAEEALLWLALEGGAFRRLAIKECCA
ncbi:Mov34/MPN/PAD-1 family protein [Sphingomonas naphthae]|uniref:Mov34/MPN/PAD-1 family protein n=1 Tax=Sphingomonas naphthae TaxID=1813468 RepID=A0ABY7TFK0_9SPHN|nr:Mov34/MPN/PAD-1 family protein [Sphingomonas naphthae]WCT71988.1 Mov34/MPN/PAD-1 family protein [Sphingomonas naphthae]